MKKLETKSTVLLKHHLKSLKMPTMHDECEKIAARCAKENVDHLGFLLQLCEQELIDREKKAAERRLRAARFPNLKTLEDFKFESQPTINRVLVSELMRMKNQLAKLDLLICDELGYVPASKLLFDVISAAYERTSVIVTFEQWTQPASYRRRSRPSNTPLPHPRSHRRQLPPEGRSPPGAQ